MRKRPCSIPSGASEADWRVLQESSELLSRPVPSSPRKSFRSITAADRVTFCGAALSMYFNAHGGRPRAPGSQLVGAAKLQTS